jgi:hypothetical protein
MEDMMEVQLDANGNRVYRPTFEFWKSTITDIDFLTYYNTVDLEEMPQTEVDADYESAYDEEQLDIMYGLY